MAQASHVFDSVITPLIAPGFMALPPDMRQAWWDGFLASIVGAMAATIGEKQTEVSCEDLYTRAKDFTADRAKLSPTDIPGGG